MERRMGRTENPPRETTMKKAIGIAALAIVLTGLLGETGNAGYRYRQYYSSWSYYSTSSYYYSRYYYYPTVQAATYSYHYVIYYPSQPRYYYYYNPTTRQYWGRYDLEAKGYSMLEEKDRKEKLSDIPDSAFPKPGAMPAVPGTEDKLKMEVPPAAPKE
jgi:hypothetical protein